MDPIEYKFDVQTPFQSAMQGYQAGSAIRQDQFQQQQQQAALLQQQQQKADLTALLQNPNPSAKDYAAMTIKYPALKDQFKQGWDMLSKDQQQGKLNTMIPAYAALSSGAPDVAAKILRDQADAMRNSGAPEKDIKAQETWADMAEKAPAQAKHIGALYLASVMDPDKFAATTASLGGEQRAQDKAPAELAKANAEATTAQAEADVAPQIAAEKLATSIWGNANTKSQIEERSKRLGLDQDKLTTETQLKLTELQQKNGELPEYVAKDVASATTDAIAAQQSATRMTDLAARIDKQASELGSGMTAKAGELWKSAFGSQNELTRIRAEYSRIVTPAAMAAYKKVAAGSTSDMDIQTAMTGVPKDTDSPERMASFLRGAAKLQQYDEVLNNAKAEWLGANRNLGKAKNDTEIDGVKVPQGMSFKQFTDQYLPRKIQQRSADQLVDDLAKKYGQ